MHGPGRTKGNLMQNKNPIKRISSISCILSFKVEQAAGNDGIDDIGSRLIPTDTTKDTISKLAEILRSSGESQLPDKGFLLNVYLPDLQTANGYPQPVVRLHDIFDAIKRKGADISAESITAALKEKAESVARSIEYADAYSREQQHTANHDE